MGDRLAGKVTIVTGAGSGIGRASAIRFAEEGAQVTCVDVNRESVEAVAREIGDAAFAVCADVSVAAQVQAYTDARPPTSRHSSPDLSSSRMAG